MINIKVHREIIGDYDYHFASLSKLITIVEGELLEYYVNTDDYKLIHNEISTK